MEVFLAGTHSRRWMLEEKIEEAMKYYLAGTMYGNMSNAAKSFGITPPLPPILESFYYVDETTEHLIPFMSDFLLDSGAFTYMTGVGGQTNWQEYIDKYASFIKRNRVEKFFELDIDSLVGYEEVKRLRTTLIAKTDRLPIPVWHKSRGKEEFLKMCDEFPYVAIGGIVTREIKKTEYKFFDWFIKEAHARGTKIHGLGLTNFDALEKYKFDSVDSSAWTCGNRFGFVSKFNGRRVVNLSKGGRGLKDPKIVALNNFNEWVKFQKYAEENL